MAHIVVNDTTPLASFAVTTASLGPFTVPSAIALFTPAQDLKVYNGTTLLTYNPTPTLATEWKFTGAVVDGGYQGGSITLGATVTNTTILVFRDIPIARTSDFNYPSPTVDIQALNTQLDKIFAIEQDNELRYSRTVRAPLTDTVLLDALPAAATRASKFLAFDANGQPTALTGTGSAGAAGQGVPIAGTANQILAKINSTDYNTQWLGLSALIDAVLGSTRGQILARGASAWVPITVGATGTVLRSDGTDPLWATLTATLDVLFGTTQGSVIYRGAAAWAALAPGTSGQFLKTLGAGSNPTWAAGAALSVAIIRDEKANGTDGGATTSGSYEDRVLNTKPFDPNGVVTLAANAFTPLAGVYFAIAILPHIWGGTGGYRDQLYNSTGATEVQAGYGSRGGTSGADQTTVSFYSFTANGTDAYKIRQQVGSSRATDGMGSHDQLSLGNEVYAQVILVKIA